MVVSFQSYQINIEIENENVKKQDIKSFAVGKYYITNECLKFQAAQFPKQDNKIMKFRIIKVKPGVLNTSAAHQMYFRGKLSRKFGQNSSQNIRSWAVILWRWDLNRLTAPRLHCFKDVFTKNIPKSLNKSYFVRTIQLSTVKEAAVKSLLFAGNTMKSSGEKLGFVNDNLYDGIALTHYVYWTLTWSMGNLPLKATGVRRMHEELKIMISRILD